MPRTFKATVALIVTLIALCVLTIINVWQIENTEEQVISLRETVTSLEKTVDKKLQGAGSGGGTREQTSEEMVAADRKYKEALQDPENILEPRENPIVPEASKKNAGGTLRRVLSTDPKGFNFVVENSVDVQEIQSYIHNEFAERDPDNPKSFVPDLAYKVTRNDDYTEYTIHLKEGVYWQLPNVDLSDEKYSWMKDQYELTADDCVFSFNLLKNDQVQAGAAKSSFEDMKEAVKVDRYTCKVIWKKKTHQSLSSTLRWYPMPKWLFGHTETGEEIPQEMLGMKFNNHWASRHPVGTGPYKFVDYTQGTEVILDRNEDFFGENPPIDRIEWQIVKKPQKAYLRLKSDSVDFIEMSPQMYRKEIVEAESDSPFKEGGDLQYEIIDEFAYYYFGWNLEKPLFEDRQVRLALTHALDRKGIIENVLNGLGVVQTGPFYHEHEANNPDIEAYEYDLEKSRDLLKKAGWTDDDDDGIREKTIDGETKKFEFSMLTYNKPSAREYVKKYKNELRKIGIILRPKPVNWPTMQKKMNEKDFDAYTGGWGLVWSIDPYQVWHSSQAEVPRGSNRIGFKNERADEIIMELRETFDPERRKELFHEFHEILHEKQPYTFFYAPKGVYAWRNRVKNVQFQKIRPQTIAFPWYIAPDQRKEDSEE